MNKWFKSIKEAVVRALYPNRCACCGRVMEHKGLCRGCEALMERVPEGTCNLCGQLIAECQCGFIKPGLNGFAAPFYNSGRSGAALYRFKFAGAVSAADFFGRSMAESFKTRFPDVKADAVCCVPDAHHSRRRNGYYTARKLAEAVASYLEIPFCEDMLVQVKHTKPQHKLGRKERLANVKGVYEAKDTAKGRNIIVVDDIRTTGATINECGRALRKAKAKGVWGITAVQSRNLQIF